MLVDDVYKKKQTTGRPKAGYRANGKRCPGVTTILGHFEGSGDGLIIWAVNLERSGQNWADVREAAANEGTAIHEAAEQVLAGTPVETAVEVVPETVRAHAANALDTFLEWQAESGIQWETYEVPLSCDEYHFGGTADILGRDREGRLHLGDWKSGSLRAKAIVQLAAYRHLIEKALGETIYRCHLMQLSRQDGSFRHIEIPQTDMSAAWEAFVACRSLYETNKRLSKLVK